MLDQIGTSVLASVSLVCLVLGDFISLIRNSVMVGGESSRSVGACLRPCDCRVLSRLMNVVWDL
jgi:hypothetical protein